MYIYFFYINVFSQFDQVKNIAKRRRRINKTMDFCVLANMSKNRTSIVGIEISIFVDWSFFCDYYCSSWISIDSFFFFLLTKYFYLINVYHIDISISCRWMKETCFFNYGISFSHHWRKRFYLRRARRKPKSCELIRLENWSVEDSTSLTVKKNADITGSDGFRRLWRIHSHDFNRTTRC